MPESEQERQVRATSLARDAERAAITLAEQRGRESATLEARLDDHDKHLKAVNGSVERTAKGLEALTREVTSLKTAYETNIRLADQRAEDAKIAAQKVADSQISFQQFLAVVIGGVGALGAIMTGIIELLGHA